MTQFGSAVSWLVLSPIALVTNIAGIAIVCHYRQQFHGTDVTFIALFVSMALNALLVLPVPAAVIISDEGWITSELCSFYVWLVLCVRMSELLTTIVMNIHWMCILRFTSGQEVYSSAMVIKVLVVVAWFAAMMTGLVPITGSAFYTYYQETSVRKVVEGNNGGARATNSSTPQYTTVVRGDCVFLPQGLGTSFIVFFILITLTTLVISLVASSDTLVVFHYMRKTAVDKYKAGRFYLPSSSLRARSAANRLYGDNRHNTGEVSYDLPGETDSELNTTHQTAGHHSGIPSLCGPIASEPNGDIVRGHLERIENTELSTVSPDHRGVSGNFPEDEGNPRLNGSGAANSAAAVVMRHSATSGVAKSNPQTVHARYNELNLSSELCRVVVLYTVLVTVLNHLPFVLLQFIQLVEEVDQQVAQATVLWLTLAQSLLAPHVLWASSRRYRHALCYTWTVHVRRDTSAKEEDPSACTLQSYTRKVRTQDGNTVKVIARARGRAPVTLATNTGNTSERQLNGSAVPVRDTESHVTHSTDVNISSSSSSVGAKEVITTDLDDGMTVITNLASQQVTYIFDLPSRTVPERPWDSPSSSQAMANSGKSPLVTPSHRDDGFTRSGSARKLWKEKMRKKHLPSIFTNQAFEPDEVTEEKNVVAEKQKSLVVTSASHNNTNDDVAGHNNDAVGDSVKISDRQFHYDGAFHHHDQLKSDSLSRMESESEGGSFQYDDNDIEGILDRQFSTKSVYFTSSFNSFTGNRAEQSPPPVTKASRHGPSGLVVSGSSKKRLSAGSSSSVKSEARSEGSDRSGPLRQDHRKPPRQTLMGMRPASRPDPQSQRTVLDALDNDVGKNTDVISQRRSEQKTNSTPSGFYPVFEGVDDRLLTSNTAGKESDVPGGGTGNYDNETDACRLQTAILPASEDAHENSSDVAKTRSRENSNTLKFAGFTYVVDAGNICLTIDSVTNDASNTEGVDAQQDSSSETETTFKPQAQASVLEMLLEHRIGDQDRSNLPEHDHLERDQTDSDIRDFPSHLHSEDYRENRSVAQSNLPTHDYTCEHEFNSSLPGSEIRRPEDYSQTMKSNIQNHLELNTDIGLLGSREVTEDTPGSSTKNDENSVITRVANDVLPPATAIVLDIEETSSTGSEPSVVLEPYHGDRRPPWMDYIDYEDEELESPQNGSGNSSGAQLAFDTSVLQESDAFANSRDSRNSFGSNSEINTIFGETLNKPDFRNPFSYASFHGSIEEDSDSGVLQSSGNREQLNDVKNDDSGFNQSCTPLFEEETDRGFENSLAMEQGLLESHYFGNFTGNRFASIEEEPEEFSDSISSSQKGDRSDFTATLAPSPRSRSGSRSSEIVSPFNLQDDSDSLWQRTLADGKEVLLELSSGYVEHEPENRDKVLPSPNGRTASLDFNTGNPAVAHRVRLTKPSPWPSVSNSNERAFNSVSNRLNDQLNDTGGDKASDRVELVSDDLTAHEQCDSNNETFQVNKHNGVGFRRTDPYVATADPVYF